MTISTISFNQAKIYKDKMFFTLYGKDGVFTRVFDKNGNNILNRISSKASKTTNKDSVIISRKKEYEYSNNNIIFEQIKRIYDKTGKFITTETTVIYH